MNAKQKKMFKQKWQEHAAVYNSNPPPLVDRGRCERIVNAVIEAGVPEIEWRIGERLVVYGFIGDARVFDLGDTMDGWLLGQDFFHSSDDDKFYPTLNEAKLAAEQAFRVWWLKAQGE